MYFFGGLNVLGLILCAFLIPSEVNSSQDEDEQLSNDIKIDELDIRSSIDNLEDKIESEDS